MSAGHERGARGGEAGPLAPPTSYRKKIVNAGGDCPLERTFTAAQVEKRIAFYGELNDKRDGLPREGAPVEKRFILRGWDETTTVRVYMRETVTRIARELFWSEYSVSVENVIDEDDEDRGHVALAVRATGPEIRALLEYIGPGSTYCVYDGEESKYRAGDTSRSEFVITKAQDPLQPKRFWRRSQSFVAAVEDAGVPPGRGERAPGVSYSASPRASQ